MINSRDIIWRNLLVILMLPIKNMPTIYSLPLAMMGHIRSPTDTMNYGLLLNECYGHGSI